MVRLVRFFVDGDGPLHQVPRRRVPALPALVQGRFVEESSGVVRDRNYRRSTRHGDHVREQFPCRLPRAEVMFLRLERRIDQTQRCFRP